MIKTANVPANVFDKLHSTVPYRKKEDVMKNINIDLRGLNPAPITPFTREGAVDYAACKKTRQLAG
ncbi:hypothetical protein DZJ_46000 [Dickeya ananatis]